MLNDEQLYFKNAQMKSKVAKSGGMPDVLSYIERCRVQPDILVMVSSPGDVVINDVSNLFFSKRPMPDN